MQTPCLDPLSDRLSITVLDANDATTAATVTGTTKTMTGAGPNPLSLAAVLVPGAVPASHTLDAKIQGSNDGTTWTDLVTFAQATNASHAAQKVNVGRAYASYRSVAVTAGAFGGPHLPYSIVLVGTNLYHTPYTDV